MPRVARSRLLVTFAVLAALGLVSCFTDVSKCPTCPDESSGRIDVLVARNGLIDSLHITVDGGDRVTVRRDPRREVRYAFRDLSVGTHAVSITRWFFIDGLLSSRSSVLEVRLERGESRTIVFHNDFPLVTWAPFPEAGRAIGRSAFGPAVPRVS